MPQLSPATAQSRTSRMEASRLIGWPPARWRATRRTATSGVSALLMFGEDLHPGPEHAGFRASALKGRHHHRVAVQDVDLEGDAGAPVSWTVRGVDSDSLYSPVHGSSMSHLMVLDPFTSRVTVTAPTLGS